MTEAWLDTPVPLQSLDDDLREFTCSHPTVVYWGESESPEEVTFTSMFVLFIVNIGWLDRNYRHQHQLFFLQLIRSSRIPGLDQSPGGALLHDCLIVQFRGIDYFAATMYYISIGRSSIRNLGTRPMACAYTRILNDFLVISLLFFFILNFYFFNKDKCSNINFIRL